MAMSAADTKAVRNDPYLPIRRSTALIIAFAALLFVVTCLIAVITSRNAVVTAKQATAAVSAVNQTFREETTCRAKYASDVDVARGELIVAQTELDLATSDYSRAFNDLIQILLEPRERQDPVALTEARVELNRSSQAGIDAQRPISVAKDKLSAATRARDSSVAHCAEQVGLGSDGQPVTTTD